MSDILQISMLGGFSVSIKDAAIDDSANRMKKVWLLLAYLICSRKQRVTQENLLSLLRGTGGDDSADPAGKLKAVLYRARAMLDELGTGWGHRLIVRKDGCYSWNEEVAIHVDAEEFELLCTAAAAEEDADRQLEQLTRALALYKGDFLPKLSMEPWVMPITTYYHEMYLRAAEQALAAMTERKQFQEAAALCLAVLHVEPYSETVYQYLIRCRIALEDRSGAVAAYEEMSEKLFATFGVMPSEESRRLYREAVRQNNSDTVPAGTVREHLKEQDAAKGAMYCEYDFFKMLYQLQARAIVRSGDTIHIALASLHGRGKKSLSRRSLDTAMDNLQNLLLSSLRQGDVVTRCSLSQFIIMLPQANYENSCAVCDRLLRAFYRQYPHSPVDIRFSVQPLEPLQREDKGR